MNLELLNHSRNQIPDRVDATLSLPPVSSPSKTSTSPKKAPTPTKSDLDTSHLKAANQVCFNRRGTYVAIGYASGTIAVFDVLSRTVLSLYSLETGTEEITTEPIDETKSRVPYTRPTPPRGISYLSWSRRSRTLLTGTFGKAAALLIDTTHPSGPEECSLNEKKEEKDKQEREDEETPKPTADKVERKEGGTSSFREKDVSIAHHRKERHLEVEQLKAGPEVASTQLKRKGHQAHVATQLSKVKRYPSLFFRFPVPVGFTLKIHPKDTNAGIASLVDGSLVAFWVPIEAWEDLGPENNPKVKVARIHQSDTYQIACASFDQSGDRVYAATTDGKLLGFEVATIFNDLAVPTKDTISPLRSGFVINVPGGASSWHLKVSRNGHYILLNSADAAIRLYSTKECWMTPEEVEKPLWVFQEASKAPFEACDFSGDGKYVLGAANGSDSYELCIWDTADGSLVDKLTGATVKLMSASWHPTRSFVAAASEDGLVDIWGPRINWTAFAPDFQALTQNIEYAECEDEFDITSEKVGGEKDASEENTEEEDVDILTIDPISVFASDSEDESEVFKFEIQVKRTIGLMNS